MFLIIIIIIIILILINNNNVNECYDNLNNEEKCEIMAQPKFMIKDLRTNLWLKVDAEYYKFVPGNFGTLFLLNENHDDNLPLRLLLNPNYYILMAYNKIDLRIVENPYAPYDKIEVFIYNGMNILGYLAQDNINYYIYINNDGSIITVDKPSLASPVLISKV